MPSFPRIVTPVGNTADDESLLRYAAMVCRLAPGAEVHCVHVRPRSSVFPELQRIEKKWDELCRHCGDPCGRGDIRFHVLEGDLTDEVLRFAVDAKAELIVVGASQRGGARRSLARRLAMKAPCSVWAVPHGSPARIGRMLVPIDFSSRSADALGVATSVAASAGLEKCEALHVFFNEANVTYDEYAEVVRDNEQTAFHIFAARIDLHGVYVKPRFVEAPQVAHAIQRVAIETAADLIVMGTRGRSRSASVLLGSETDQMLRSTTIPVLAVKHFGARMRLLQALLERRKAGRPKSGFN
jgi:nucleotide-binding universal stress UspA family protein